MNPEYSRVIHLSTVDSDWATHYRAYLPPIALGAEDTLTGAGASGDGEVLIGQWASDVLGVSALQAGDWVLKAWAKVSSSSGVTQIKAYVSLLDVSGDETALFDATSAEINDLTPALQTITYAGSLESANPTDRLIVRIYHLTDNGSSITTTLYLQGETQQSRVLIPTNLPIAHGDMFTHVYDPDRDAFISWDQISDKPLFETLFAHNDPSDISPYEKLLTTPTADPESDDTAVTNAASGEVLIDGYITYPTDGLGVALINGGTWTFVVWGYVGPAVGTNTIVVRVYKRSQGGTETELFDIETPALTASLAQYEVSTSQDNIALDPSDRLLVKYFAKSTSVPDRTIHLVYEGTTHYSHIHPPQLTGGAAGGDVTGPGFSTDEHIVIFDGASGKIIQDSGKLLSEYAELAGATFTGNVVINAQLGINEATPYANSGLDIASGHVSLVLGADQTATTRTNNTLHAGRIAVPHYDLSEEPAAVLYAYSTLNSNALNLGGGTTLMNSVQNIIFYTGATYTTLTGTQRMLIASNGQISIGQHSPSAKLDVASGNMTLLLGADSSAEDSRTDATTKYARIGVPHYTNAEEPAGLAVLSSTITGNNLTFGGGSSLFNAATTIIFYTAANNVTQTGSEILRLTNAGGAAGRVGINNTTTPSAHLHVKGGATDIMRIDANTGVNTMVRWLENAVETGAIFSLTGSTDFSVRAKGILNLGANGSDTNGITILTSGYVGVKQTTPTSTLHGGGSFALPIVVKSADYTATSSDCIINYVFSSGVKTLSLPDATTCAGRIYFISMLGSSGTAALTIDPYSTQLINGSASVERLAGQTMIITSNGTGWISLA